MTDLFQQDDTPVVDQDKDYLSELVGDGKKFKTEKDLARGKYEADMLIEIMKRQNDQLRKDYLAMREENMAKAKLEELMDQYSKPAGSNDTVVKEPEIKPQYTPDQIKEIVASSVKELEMTKSRAENSKSVMGKLKERYGAKYLDVLQQKTEELGLTKEMVNNLAETAPKAFFKAMELDQEPKTDPFQAPPRSQQSSSFQPTGAKKRTWSYYQEMKKTNPKLYFDPKIAVQMDKDYQALGAEFEDGDFHAI